jgi:hypothetical protein
MDEITIRIKEEVKKERREGGCDYSPDGIEGIDVISRLNKKYKTVRIDCEIGGVLGVDISLRSLSWGGNHSCLCVSQSVSRLLLQCVCVE